MNQLGMREEHRTGLMRGLATGALNFGVATLTTFSTTDDWQAALVTGGIVGLTSLGAFWGLGVADARANDRAENGP